MRVVKTEPSIEPCEIASWYAWDLWFDRPLSDEVIRGMRGLGGSFVYLESLRHPFFKIEDNGMLIRGTKGENHLRAALSEDRKEDLGKIRDFLERLPDGSSEAAAADGGAAGDRGAT
ncbi:MAG: hypothetical protein ACOX8B_07405 [Lachnospiraceae bacterium]|jgi:hypothetical protein